MKLNKHDKNVVYTFGFAFLCGILLMLMYLPFVGVGLVGNTSSLNAALRSYADSMGYIWVIPLLYLTIVCSIRAAFLPSYVVLMMWGTVIAMPCFIALFQLRIIPLNWDMNYARWTNYDIIIWGSLPTVGLVAFTLIFLAGWLANRQSEPPLPQFSRKKVAQLEESDTRDDNT